MEEEQIKSDVEMKVFCKKMLEKSGYLFENKVEKELKKSGFYTEREIPYLDKDEQESRAIDILADKGVLLDHDKTVKTGFRMGLFRLIIECKSLPNSGWIFYPNKKKLMDSQSSLIWINPPKQPNELHHIKTRISEIPFASTYVAYSFDPRTNNEAKNNKNLLRDAIVKVTKGTRAIIDNESDTYNRLVAQGYSKNFARSPYDFMIFQSLIIFGGRLYVANDDDNLESADFIQIEKKWLSKKYEEFIGEIHIVSFEKLAKYLEILKNYYNFIGK